jgi:hypothetical protein
MFIRRARIIDNDDRNKPNNLYSKRCKVKIRIYPEMENILEDYLQWAEPLFNNFIDIPNIGDWVYVLCFDNFYQDIRYIPTVYLRETEKYKYFDDNIKDNIEELGDIEYPEPLTLKKIGLTDSYFFVDNENSQIGFFHFSNTYLR